MHSQCYKRGLSGPRTLWICMESITCGWRSWSLRVCHSCCWHGNRSSCHVPDREIKGHWAQGCLELNGSTAAVSEPVSLYMTFRTDSFFSFSKQRNKWNRKRSAKKLRGFLILLFQAWVHCPVDTEGPWQGSLGACSEVADNADGMMYGQRKAHAPAVLWPRSTHSW